MKTVGTLAGIGCLCGLFWCAAGTSPAAVGWTATASSNWSLGYAADAAADGLAGVSGNYWQTVAGEDKGAWWRADLGEEVTVQGVRIAWACYHGKVHSPPARVLVQTAVVGPAGPWTQILEIAPGKIPRGGAPCDFGRPSEFPLERPVTARWLRLSFPDGGQPGADPDGYICLGEVEVMGPAFTPRVVNLEGPFGRVAVNVSRPSLSSLELRGGPQSLLAAAGRKSWARGGLTYAVAEDGKRFESRLAEPEGFEVTREGGRDAVRLRGVKLVAAAGEAPVAVEDWTLSAPGDGSALVWKIERRWRSDFTAVLAGSPALFFSFDAKRWKNSTAHTIWYDPMYLAIAGSNLLEGGLYQLQLRLGREGKISSNLLQTVRDRDTWAVYKLWTTWGAPADLRLEVNGGHLYRRGSSAYLSEAGAVTEAGPLQVCRAGQSETVALRIGAADKLATAYQLAVDLPDKATETALKDFYDAVLNGGAVNDQKGYDFGNQTDGWYYTGSCWMYGAALSAGVAAPAASSARPYDAAQAFREHLAHVLATLDENGLTHFGYNHGGECVDDNLHAILGAHFYLLHTGDVLFIRQQLPALEKMLEYFIGRINSQGLFELAGAGAHWYYDAIYTSGVNSYYNAFIFKAATALAEMEEAGGRAPQADRYRALAASIKAAFNKVLWREDASGGPRYADWIDAEGRDVTYFCDLCQWPPIAVGIAPPERARKIVATADARIAQLEKEYGYQGYAGLSALWPVPKHLHIERRRNLGYGSYMDGGSLLAQTYWEVMARTRAGDAAGAARRMKGFARRAAEIHWAGDNAADIHGEMVKGDGEPYLADMVCATAALVHGILGIQPTWDKLVVNPCLPAEWPRAGAEALYKGRRHRVTIKDGQVQVEPLEQRLEWPPLLWNMDFNLHRTAFGQAQTENVEFVGFYANEVTLAKGAASGRYLSPAYDWTVPARLREITLAAELRGGGGDVVVETSNDAFKTVAARVEFPLRDGVTPYPLEGLKPAARAGRVGFTLARGAWKTAAPVVDAFRIAGEAAE